VTVALVEAVMVVCRVMVFKAPMVLVAVAVAVATTGQAMRALEATEATVLP